MNQLLRQAKQMQEDMMKTHSEIESKEFDVTSGGGAITVTMTGKKMIKAIKISPDVLDKEDVDYDKSDMSMYYGVLPYGYGWIFPKKNHFFIPESPPFSRFSSHRSLRAI